VDRDRPEASASRDRDGALPLAIRERIAPEPEGRYRPVPQSSMRAYISLMRF
jgi:hypothetical protein